MPPTRIWLYHIAYMTKNHIGKLMERIIQWIDLWDDSIDTMVFSYGACSVNIPYKGFPADFPFIQIWEMMKCEWLRMPGHIPCIMWYIGYTVSNDRKKSLDSWVSPNWGWGNETQRSFTNLLGVMLPEQSCEGIRWSRDFIPTHKVVKPMKHHVPL